MICGDAGARGSTGSRFAPSRWKAATRSASANSRSPYFYDEPPDLAAPERLTDNASGAETSLSDIESPYLHDEPVPETAVARPEETGREDAEWHGSIFQIEPTAKTLVVIPIADHCGFRYQQLHVEANKLQRMFETRAFEHLVMDLEQLSYFGTELIGVMIRLARAVTNFGGKSAFCARLPACWKCWRA